MDRLSVDTSAETPWYAQEVEEVIATLDTDSINGLTQLEAGARLETYGPNSLPSPPSSSLWQTAREQLLDPMNIMLAVVAIFSVIIDQRPLAAVVAVLVGVNVVLGSRQERNAQKSVDALAALNLPTARVIRDGAVRRVEATELVPGDLINLEAGDLVPADGRIVRCTSLETQEAALTGESLPVPKGAAALGAADAELGDRTSVVFQNTQVTRGTASVVVTETGMRTQMGRIASMLSAVTPAKSPLQRELASLTKVLGIIAWGTVVLSIAIGIARGNSVEMVVLLGVSMAISAIPTGMPTFVQAMLASGSKQLAEHNAIVKSLNDVETLGATSAINSDKTGTLTMNEMTVERLFFAGEWYSVSGTGYSFEGAVHQVAGRPAPDFTPLARGLSVCSDAVVTADGRTIGDPTEAALVVLAAKMGVDADLTRRDLPRVAEVPFDSDYKFMATFHRFERSGDDGMMAFVKGGPDVLLERCTHALLPDGTDAPVEEFAEEIGRANQGLSELGLRVLAFAYRRYADEEFAAYSRPMDAVEGLTFIGMVGIIDPLRPSSRDAVHVAHEAGIEVRMITGDHAVTAAAIGGQLELGEGTISGAELRTMTDGEIAAALPEIHVFGRVTPEDKLRLARIMQECGDVVAMTGDAVNDAAALKQADVGVAMGSGAEVTKQAAKMILTDDDFGTLVQAIRLGRSIYEKITGYVRFQMSQLLSLVTLFLAASVMNINNGTPMTPMMVLFLNFFICAFPTVVILTDPVAGDIMKRKPRDPNAPLASRAAVRQWILYGGSLFLVMLAPLLGVGAGAGAGSQVMMTMTFVVCALGSIFSGLVLRRDPASGLGSPILNAVSWLSIPLVLTLGAVESPTMQSLLSTVSLSSDQWLICIGLALIVPVVVEVDKCIRRRRAAAKLEVGN